MFDLVKRTLGKKKQPESPGVTIEQMEAHVPTDRREDVNERVLARFEFPLPNENIFNQYQVNGTGCCVLNSNGGCFYFGNSMTEERLSRSFPQDMIIPIKGLILTSTIDDSITELKNLPVTFQGFRPTLASSGLVLKFVNPDTVHRRQLLQLPKRYLSVGNRENWDEIKQFV